MHFGGSIEVSSPAEHVFKFVSTPENLPRYLSTVHHAWSPGEGQIAVEGEIEGRRYQNDGWFSLDEKNMSMTWGSKGANAYEGTLTVFPDSPESCRVELAINFQPHEGQEQEFQAEMGNRFGAIQQGLDRALNSIKLICEAEAGNLPADLEPGRKGYVT